MQSVSIRKRTIEKEVTTTRKQIAKQIFLQILYFPSQLNKNHRYRFEHLLSSQAIETNFPADLPRRQRHPLGEAFVSFDTG